VAVVVVVVRVLHDCRAGGMDRSIALRCGPAYMRLVRLGARPARSAWSSRHVVGVVGNGSDQRTCTLHGLHERAGTRIARRGRWGRAGPRGVEGDVAPATWPGGGGFRLEEARGGRTSRVKTCVVSDCEPPCTAYVFGR
jgi:hypothetical protein